MHFGGGFFVIEYDVCRRPFSNITSMSHEGRKILFPAGYNI